MKQDESHHLRLLFREVVGIFVDSLVTCRTHSVQPLPYSFRLDLLTHKGSYKEALTVQVPNFDKRIRYVINIIVCTILCTIYYAYLFISHFELSSRLRASF